MFSQMKKVATTRIKSDTRFFQRFYVLHLSDLASANYHFPMWIYEGVETTDTIYSSTAASIFGPIHIIGLSE